MGGIKLIKCSLCFGLLDYYRVLINCSGYVVPCCWYTASAADDDDDYTIRYTDASCIVVFLLQVPHPD